MKHIQKRACGFALMLRQRFVMVANVVGRGAVGGVVGEGAASELFEVVDSIGRIF